MDNNSSPFASVVLPVLRNISNLMGGSEEQIEVIINSFL